MIDLHVHTTASDGQYPPGELLRKAWEAGVRVVGVTDHDTVEGLAEAGEEAARLGARLVPGIELSAFVQGREAHVLGHFIDPGWPRLRELAGFLRRQRETRMVGMLERLDALGIPVSLAEVVAASGGENLGRPHLARVLIERRVVRSVREAFDRFLSVGKPAYVERYRLSTEDAIALIREAGGVATLAHAFSSGVNRAELVLLKGQGLEGLEVAHSCHPPQAVEALRRIAEELDLVPTAGSDYHGERVMPDRFLGVLSMQPEELERLEGRRPR